jgi:hypothetical protein
VTVKATHLKGHTWQFRYAVRNTGTDPIAGFQLTSAAANLFRIRTQPGWSYYGSGVCGEKHPGILIYWSTATTSRGVIRPRRIGQFIFQVNTGGLRKMLYALSWDSAAPQFGSVVGPAASTLARSGPCRG